jgi:type I restriction enzyme, S subunit
MKLVKLSEICTFSRGLTYGKSDEVEFSKNVVLRANNIDLHSNSLNLEDLRYIKDSIQIKQEKIAKKNSLIICTASGSKSHVGKVALIDEDYGYAFGGFMGQLTPTDNCHPKFLYYVLTSGFFKDFLMSLNDGTNINNLKFSDIENYEILLPSLEKQREIVKKLDTTFVEIASLERNLEKSDKKVSQLMTSVLGWSFRHSSFEFSEISDMPGKESVNISTLGEIMEFQNGRAFKSSEWRDRGLPIIRIQNLNNRNSSYNYFDGIFDDRILINEGDLLFSWSGTVGTSFGPHIWMGSNALLNQHIFKVTLNPRIEKKYAFYALQSITSLIEDSVNGAVGLTHITKAKLVNFEIPLPPLTEQQKIIEKLDSVFAEISCLKDQIGARQKFATALRQSLLRSALFELEGVA